jgi:hypothetical protein
MLDVRKIDSSEDAKADGTGQQNNESEPKRMEKDRGNDPEH